MPPNGWTDQDETRHADRPRPWPHCVRWTQLPLPQRGTAPIFGLYLCGQMAEWIKMPLGMKVGFDTSDIVLDADPAALFPKRIQSPPQFSAHVYCGQTAAWISMPLGIEIGLGPGHIVLDGDPLPSPKRGHTPNFAPCLLWPNGWMDQDATWYESKPRHKRHCVRWGASSPKRGTAPNFRPMSVVAKQLNALGYHLVRR